MKYYKDNSIPLEEDFPGIGETSFDEYGNYVEINAFNEGTIIVHTTLHDGQTLEKFEKSNTPADKRWLKSFWSLTNKKINKDEIYNTSEGES